MAVRVVIVVLLALLGSAAALPPFLTSHVRAMRELRSSTQEAELQAAVGDRDLPEAQWITQPLDHFDATNMDTYKQRYYVNSTFWDASGKTGPVFLYIGGEGAQSPRAVVFGHMVKMAEQNGALMFAVEHRTYGASVIAADMSTPNLAHLSSQQALADLAAFYSFAMSKFDVPAEAPWVSFGGSYPGALSAFFRLKYPHVVDAAVASSAPVRAIEDFTGYHDVVAASLSDPTVGGSGSCASNIKQAFATLGGCINDPSKRSQLAKDFMSCGSLDADEDAETFISNLAGIFDETVQYNNIIPGINIAAICEIMTNTTMDPVSNLKALNAAMMAQTGQKCMDNSFADSIAPVLNTTVDPTATGVGIRQWMWQVCTQFGYLQTCEEGTDCLFQPNPGISLDAQLALCKQAFGVEATEVSQRINFTNAYYGGDSADGSDILFVNGSIDPWHALSVLPPVHGMDASIFINGTAHCANMESDMPNDPKSLVEARQQIEAQVGKWVGKHVA